uniref:Uncharacterized protein n=1 Tax=Glossina austeni TaxID=7395 RepID=A0A1A9VA49_GLOAU
MYTTYIMFEAVEEDDSLQQINEDHNSKNKSTDGDVGKEQLPQRCNKRPMRCGCRPRKNGKLPRWCRTIKCNDRKWQFASKDLLKWKSNYNAIVAIIAVQNRRPPKFGSKLAPGLTVVGKPFGRSGRKASPKSSSFGIGEATAPTTIRNYFRSGKYKAQIKEVENINVGSIVQHITCFLNSTDSRASNARMMEKDILARIPKLCAYTNATNDPD